MSGSLQQLLLFFMFEFFLRKNAKGLSVCLYFWLRWIFIVAPRLPQVVANGGYSVVEQEL